MKQSTKNFLLITGFFLVLMVAYQYSFSKTFEVKRELDNIKSQVEQNSRSHQNQTSLKEKEAQFDTFIAGNRIGNTSPQNNLLKVLNEHAEEKSYKIIKFKEPHVVANDNSIVASYQFTLEGNYRALQEVLYKLEKDYNFGSLSSISFERKMDHQLNRSFLQCTIFVRSIINKQKYPS